MRSLHRPDCFCAGSQLYVPHVISSAFAVLILSESGAAVSLEMLFLLQGSLVPGSAAELQVASHAEQNRFNSLMRANQGNGLSWHRLDHWPKTSNKSPHSAESSPVPRAALQLRTKSTLS